LLTRTILTHWQSLNKRAIAAYTALYSLAEADSLPGQMYIRCEAFQAELARAAGMGTRNFRRAVAELETLEIIRVERYYSPETRRTKNRYLLLDQIPTTDQADTMESTYPLPQPDRMQSGYPSHQADNMESGRGGQPDRMESAMMIHDDDDRIEKELILQQLDFLHEGERRKRAKQKHVTVAYARRWREWWERCDFGQLTNPAGFANEAIKKGHAPPQQQALPGGVLFDETDFVWSASMTETQGESQDEVAWKAILAQLERQMTRATFDTWLRGTKPLHREGETVIIGVKYHNAKLWIDNLLYETISRTAADYRLAAIWFEVEPEWAYD